MQMVSSLLPPPPDPVEVQKLRAQTLVVGGKRGAKRRSRGLSGFATSSRPRSTTAAGKWQQTGTCVRVWE